MYHICRYIRARISIIIYVYTHIYIIYIYIYHICMLNSISWYLYPTYADLSHIFTYSHIVIYWFSFICFLVCIHLGYITSALLFSQKKRRNCAISFYIYIYKRTNCCVIIYTSIYPTFRYCLLISYSGAQVMDSSFTFRALGQTGRWPSGSGKSPFFGYGENMELEYIQCEAPVR